MEFLLDILDIELKKKKEKFIKFKTWKLNIIIESKYFKKNDIKKN